MGSTQLKAKRIFCVCSKSSKEKNSISRAIKDLETELGFQLIKRTGTHILLTEEGKLVLEKGGLHSSKQSGFSAYAVSQARKKNLLVKY